MSASEMVKLLQELIEQYGDKQVKMSTEDGNFAVEGVCIHHKAQEYFKVY